MIRLLFLYFSLFTLPLFAFQTIKIAAVRVEFALDNNELTTGNGKFLIDSVTTDPFAIDPAPHNRTYFKDQLIAADNYFNTVSEGLVRITGDVFPKELNSAYQLTNQMGYYNPNTSQNAIDQGIANLFADAITAADSDPAWSYQDYDLVVIFHAGVGRDIDLGFDETPQDIPSLFVNQAFMQKNYQDSFAGIEVDNGETRVKQGIILPETENQQDVQVALTGIFVSNIGSYLGLYDLFSPSEQRSGIGRFGLMDVGLFNINGLIPAPPSAFSRQLLGWQEANILNTNSSQVTISRYLESNSEAPALIEIPINEDESYLIEYRGSHLDNIDSLLFEISEGRDTFAGYLEVLKSFFSDRINVSDSSGVLLSVDNYDLGLPGSGLLIWHIDRSVIRNSENNAINNNPDWRAVDLEEADGSQDIGEQYSLLQAGYQSELGTVLDYWFSDNPAPLYENSFNTSSTPPSLSNLNRAKTGIEISNISNNKTDQMTFSFSRDFYNEGYPLNLNTKSDKLFSVVSKPAGQQNDFLFIVTDSGKVFAVGKNGEGLFYPDKKLIARSVGNGGGTLSIALSDSFLFVMSGATLSGFDLTTTDSDSLANRTFEKGDLTIASSNIVISDRHIFYSDGSNIYGYNFNGQPFSSPEPLLQDSVNYLLIDKITPIKLGAGDYIARFEESTVVLADNDLSTNSSHILFYDNVDSENPQLIADFSVEYMQGQFSLNDIDANGVIDIVFNAKDQLVAHNKNGSLVSGFPIFPDLVAGEELIGTPMIVDLSGDGENIIMVTTNRGQILAYNTFGKLEEGFPLNTGGELTGPVSVMQMDDDPLLEFISVSKGGIVSAWEIRDSGAQSKIIWGMPYLNSTNNVLFAKSYQPKGIGSALVPQSRYYNYPNPNEGDNTTIRYYLNEAAKVKLYIFDAAGFKIDEFSGPGLANTDNEVDWNVGNVASGVYVCQLEAKSDSKTERRLIKILVVH